MKILVLFICVATVAASEVDRNFFISHGIPPAREPDARSIKKPIWRTIPQRLDNFDPTNPRKWQMRFIENGQFFQKGGPIFIMLGAEWIIDEGWLQSGQMYDIAGVHNAQMYYTEHRYYGKSYPTVNFSTGNLRYLTADQALADVANFIQFIKSDSTFTNSKVVVFGGSYGATMATWMRQKYPQLVHAAVASSAPLNAKIDFWEYHNVVKTALGKECAAVLQNASKQILQLIQSGNAKKVEEDFRTCSSIKDEADVQTLFMYLASKLGGLIQYGNKGTAKQICSQLQDPIYLSAYDSVAAYNRDSFCKGNYQSILNYYKNTALTTEIGRQWFYQTCTNFGWFQTAWGNSSLYDFGVSPDFYVKLCKDVFGSKISALLPDNVALTNTEHGGLKVGITRVISIHGSIDPWHSIGVNQDINPDSPTYVVPLASHCQDMYSITGLESIEMDEAKRAVSKYIAKWLQMPY